MQVMVDGLLTSYEQSGTGPTILVLHGWGDRAASLRGLQQVFAAKYRIITPDLPGFGDTQVPANVWGLEDYASFVASFLKKLGVKKVHAIIGHSNGGAIAIRGLATGILHTERLVLLASAGVRGEYSFRTRALQYVTKTGKLLTFVLPAHAKQALRQTLYKRIGSDLLVAEHLQETFKKIVADDVRGDAAKLRLPTLLVYGDKDRSTPLRYGQQLQHAIPGAQLEVIAGAGHFLHVDRPAKVEHVLEEFLT